MTLTGVLREGAGGSGVAVLDLQEGPDIQFVSSSIFGCGITSKGRARLVWIACSSIRGVPNSTSRDNASEQLRLVTLDSNGRGRTEQSGPFGRGIWFDAKGSDIYAIGQRGGSFVFAKRWGTPSWDTRIADAQ